MEGEKGHPFNIEELLKQRLPDDITVKELKAFMMTWPELRLDEAGYEIDNIKVIWTRFKPKLAEVPDNMTMDEFRWLIMDFDPPQLEIVLSYRRGGVGAKERTPELV